MPFNLIKPAHRYGRIPPNLFNLRSGSDSLLRGFYRQIAEAEAECPPEGYTFHDHCFIYDGCFVLTPDLEWVAGTVVDYGIAETIRPVLQGVIRGRHHRALGDAPGNTVVIAKAGADNYGHVLTDILPKLVNVARSGLSPIRLLLPTGMRHFGGPIAALLAYAGVQADLEWHAPATLLEAHGVYVFSPVGQHNTRKSATFLELADMVCAMYGVRMAPTRRIYVRRAPGESRTVQAGAAVEAAFARHGYESVHPAELPFEGQVRLFAAASHVAGGLGAGLANIGWAPPGCDVLMLDPGLGDFYFWDLACLLQHRFNWLFAAPLHGYRPDPPDSSYPIDLDLLTATLRAVHS